MTALASIIPDSNYLFSAHSSTTTNSAADTIPTDGNVNVNGNSSASDKSSRRPLNTAEFLRTLEQRHNQTLMLNVLRDNVVDAPSLTGVFLDYETYGLPGYTLGEKEHVKEITLAVLRALKENTKVTEFILNLKALELLLLPPSSPTHSQEQTQQDDGIHCLIHFLKHNPSLTTLHIRIPPSSPSTQHLFRGLFETCQCKHLQVVSLWIPRESTYHLDMMRLMSGGRRRQQRGTPTTAVADAAAAAAAAATALDVVPPIRNVDRCGDYYSLQGIASFLVVQPVLTHLRIQSSSLRNAQWWELMKGLATTGQVGSSVYHLELRRVEFEEQYQERSNDDNDNNNPIDGQTVDDLDPSQSLALLAPHLRRLDLHGTALDTSPLLIAKSILQHSSSTVPPCEPLHILSLSSSKLVRYDFLMQVLSAPNASLKGLELSHLNLSGDKCRRLAAMLRRNKSIQHLDISCAQLNCVDGACLATALADNSTILTVMAKENHLWQHRPTTDTANTQVQPVYSATTASTRNSNLMAPDDVFVAFAKLLEANTKLLALDLSENGHGLMGQEPQFALLLNGLCFNTNLKSLNMANRPNTFLDFQAYRDDTTDHQALANTELHPSLCKVLASILRRDTLHKLILNFCLIGDTNIANVLAPALQSNQNLRVLGLKGTGIQDFAMMALARSLKRHPSIAILDVSFNHLVNREGFECLSKTIETLPNLHTLWFHGMTRNRQEKHLKQQYEYTQIIGRALKNNMSLKVMSHVDWLKKEQRYYLRLNQWDRQQLTTMDNIPTSLWPKLLAGMPVQVLSFYVRRNVTLLSSVSGATLGKRKSMDSAKYHGSPFGKRQKCGSRATSS